MDNLIYNYVELLKQVEEMDVVTLNDIKYMGNLKKKRTERKLSVLNMLPKCDFVNRLKEQTKNENLEIQSNLAYWTFYKLQETLKCENLDLSEEPKNEEEKLKLYDYFLHLVLIHDEKDIKNVIGVDNKLIFFDEDNKMYSDNYKLHTPISKCKDRSFLKLVNDILENIGVEQSIDSETKKLTNEEGPLLFSDVDHKFYMCDLNNLTNLLILFKDGSIRNIKIGNFCSYKEIEYTSLNEKKSLSQLSRVKKNK